MSRLVFKSAAILLATGTVSAGQLPVPKVPVTTTASVNSQSPMVRDVPTGRVRPFSTIQGNALDSANGQMPSTVVRLRDARFGRILDTELTDRSGLFEFRGIDPGSYIVELMGNDSSVLAASQILSVNAGEMVSAVVKLPIRTQTLADMLGANTTQTAAAIMTEAAANGIVAVAATDPVSPIE
ncbi:MAG TPA: hypothetical protein VKD69_14175 [Vicinamibacterales bacterium]|nr:hypothetical protein [Vicinamibacterales bacterium]